MLELNGGRGRNRTFNLSVKSRMLTLGVYVFSTEYRGANRNDRSLWGAQFGEEFGEVLALS